MVLSKSFPIRNYKKYQIRTGRLKGNILSARGKFEQAQVEIERALALALQLGNPTQLWRTQQALGNLLLESGKSRQAGSQFRSACKIIQGVADGLTDPELKEGFLHSAPILDIFVRAQAT